MRAVRIIVGLTLALLAGAACGRLETRNDRPMPNPVDDPYAAATGTAEIVLSPALRDLRPGERPPPNSDEAGLWMLMDHMEERIRTSGNLVRDEALNAYVKGLVCKLAGAYCSDIRPYVFRMPAFNAMMGPNGVMVVWTGVLLRCRNEAQLAAVLGHEIGHYLRRHSLQRVRDTRSKADFASLFTFGAAAAGLPVAGDIAYLAVIGSIFAFSRDNEREADDFGVDVMAKAGYDPREAAKVWRQLIREEEADKDRKARSIFFATHPPAEERMQTLVRRAEAIVAAGGRFDTGAIRFDRAVRRVRSAYLRDELRQRRLSRTQVVLSRLIADHADDGELHYFQGELYRIRGGDGDREKALAAYAKALEVGGAPPRTYRSLGLMYARTGEGEKARRAFARYLALERAAEDRAMVRALIRQLG